MLVADPTYSSGMVSFGGAKSSVHSAFDEIYLFIYPNEVHKIKG
jgi:hypothetical protein